MAVPPLSVSMPALYSSTEARHTWRKVAAADGAGSGSRSARARALATLAPDTRISCPGRASTDLGFTRDRHFIGASRVNPTCGERRSGTQGPHDDWKVLPMSTCDSPAGPTIRRLPAAKGPFVCYPTNGPQPLLPHLVPGSCTKKVQEPHAWFKLCFGGT